MKIAQYGNDRTVVRASLTISSGGVVRVGVVGTGGLTLQSEHVLVHEQVQILAFFGSFYR